ncbi:ribose-phosphate diphosphokinase [Oceanobacillus sp. CFH 90083]|uniref:ribose-phosphate diphosphokinase n=1 Tax=Oceanobacillus sp. CFH 90083 TaxID=2592336 RepID=UPI00128E9491|nr:ribose-phosphate diphosphokinase [Oceanobacillus sp. CFH 90083]
MNDFKILIAPSARESLDKYEEAYGGHVEIIGKRTFPDGEFVIKVDSNLDGNIVFIVQSGVPDQHMCLFEVLQIAEVAKTKGAKDIVLVSPYLSFSRQDRRTHEGEPFTLKLICDLYRMNGISTIITVDVHNMFAFRNIDINIINIDPIDIWSQYFSLKDLETVVLLSPDNGGGKRISNYARRLGIPSVSLDKNKDITGKTWYTEANEDVINRLRKRDVLIIDDLCSSGSTFIPLANFLLNYHPKSITYAITHFFGDEEHIKNQIHSPVNILFSDTIPSRKHTISVFELISQQIDLYKKDVAR